MFLYHLTDYEFLEEKIVDFRAYWKSFRGSFALRVKKRVCLFPGELM